MSTPNIITTGHNADGLSVFIPNPEYKVFSPQIGVVYSSDGSPLDLNNNADISTFASRDYPSLIPKEGSAVLFAEWPPSADGPAGFHRTLSVDFCVMLSGQIECHLDSGEIRLVKQGDVLWQRGTKHTWVNPSSTEAARMLCFALPSKPVEGVKD